MHADTHQLKTVMLFERRYIIPTFQRDYEWTRSEQWELLFEDLDNAATRLGQARQHAQATGGSVAKAEEGVAPHFLGAVVCERLSTPSGGIDMRAVIDGQQRLTTLQLMVRALLDVLLKKGSSRAGKVRRLLENPEDVVTQPHERHKLWPRRKDRDVWPVAMSDNLSPAAPGEHPYLQARRYFAGAIAEVATGLDGRDRTDDLVDALLDLFKLVFIDLDANDDAQVIFEVLNGRQTTLSAADLVKNLLFLRGELRDENAIDRLYDQYWAPFDEPWWKIRVGTGHAARFHRDTLLSVWLTGASGSEAAVGHLYGEVRAYLAGHDRKTEEVLAEIAEYARAYQVVYRHTPDPSPKIATSYARIIALRVQTAVPLLVWLRTLPAARLSPDEHEVAVQAVESWIVRGMLTGAQTRGYGAAFMTVLKAAIAAAADPDFSVSGAVVTALRSAPNSVEWPDDTAVENAFATAPFYDRFTQERILMVLGAIDAQLRSENPKTEPASFDYTKLQIEHVMPRRWATHWPLPEQDDDATQRLTPQRDVALNGIGNLTLVTANFNQSVSNLSWAVKRPALAAQSALQLNVTVAGAEEWDEQTITDRAIELAKVACRIWPTTFDTV